MKNTKPLLNCILILAFSCFIQFVNAQIVYTDVNPDEKFNCTTPCSSVYNLDLNNDGNVDFQINLSKQLSNPFCPGLNQGVDVTAFDSNKVSHSISECPSVLSVNDSIDSNISWDGSCLTLYNVHHVAHPFGPCTTVTIGNWSGAFDKYLGLQLNIGSNTFCGWVRLNVGFSGSSFRVKDYAYNSISGQPILAGQTCLPQAAITANGPTTFCSGDSVILTSANSGTNLSYKWKLNGNKIGGATNKTYTAKVAGKYEVRVTDNINVCSATSAKVKVKVPCKVLNEEMNDEGIVTLTAYPNPFSSSTTISFSLPQSENVSLRVYDLEGRLIRVLVNENMSDATRTLAWDARNENGNVVSEGIYLLQFSTSENSETMKLIVAK